MPETKQIAEEPLKNPISVQKPADKKFIVGLHCEFVVLSHAKEMAEEAVRIAMSGDEGSHDMLKFLLGRVLRNPNQALKPYVEEEEQKDQGQSKEEFFNMYAALIEECNAANRSSDEGEEDGD